MKITITKVLKDEVTVSGQPLKREYVENVMLPLLMAQCGRDNGAKFHVIKTFDEAGLSLKAVPDDARTYVLTKRANQEQREKDLQAAREHAERCREHTPREIAQAKADREARNAAIREHGQKILAARRNNSGGW